MYKLPDDTLHDCMFDIQQVAQHHPLSYVITKKQNLMVGPTTCKPAIHALAYTGIRPKVEVRHRNLLQHLGVKHLTLYNYQPEMITYNGCK